VISGRWREHPEARAELLAESDRLPVDVAEHLVTSAETAVEDVLEAPDSWPKVPYWDKLPTLRRRKIKPFRINVVYYVDGDEVRVIAYAHERRKPGYWVRRIDDWAE
jgi:hypothetical protein